LSKVDKAKEQIAYLKFWLGVMVVTDISLVGWLVSGSGSAPNYKVAAAVVAVVVITVSGFIVHRRVEQRIDALEDL
jgi:putative flippase GtrA